MPSTFGHVLAVIPARLGSRRLPRKVLLEIAGEPMIAWVYRAARACPLLDQVLIATDSEEVLNFAQAHNLPAVFTPEDCASGTDRVYAVAQSIPADIYVNIQGDEPLLTPDHFTPMLKLFERPEVQVATLAVRCPAADIHNPNAVKVVTASDDRALYFSRHHPLRSRQHRIFRIPQASRRLRLPEGSASEIRLAPSLMDRTGRTPRATPAPRQRH